MDANKKSQKNKFKEAARVHEVDEDERSFDDKLRRISKQQPKKEKPAD
jgi:hypothetical protein|tara:strand:+ start:1619 stop:1762 length:144 start_codon:yes stop_codon:yes gene_type:complete